MDRTEQTSLAIAVAGHVLLFTLLSLGLVSKAKLPPAVNEPMEVQFVDAIGLKSAAPHPATEAPAESQAPEVAKPEEPAPAPEPTPAPPRPEPVPKPAPVPAPKPAPKPAPRPKPAEKAPPAKAAENNEPRRRPDHQPQAKTAPAKPTKAAGARLGPDFLKGIAPEKSAGRAHTPRASTVSAQARAAIAAAIARQIKPCYDLGPLGGTPAMEIITTLELKFNRDGTIANIGTEAQQTGVNATNRAYRRQIAEVAINAVRRCAPLRLPADLYEDGWQNILFTFTPKQLG